jgi:hypothetical protein
VEEPSLEEMYRALAALQPFVGAYGLPVNPENLELMVYAMLRYLRSSESVDDVIGAVEGLIEEERQAHAAMGHAMARNIAARGPSLVQEPAPATGAPATDRITEEEIAAIEARVLAASAGPWTSYVEGRDHLGGDDFIRIGEQDALPDMYVSMFGPGPGQRTASVPDQDFIAAARQDVPRLLAEVRRLRAAAQTPGG